MNLTAGVSLYGGAAYLPAEAGAVTLNRLREHFSVGTLTIDVHHNLSYLAPLLARSLARSPAKLLFESELASVLKQERLVASCTLEECSSKDNQLSTTSSPADRFVTILSLSLCVSLSSLTFLTPVFACVFGNLLLQETFNASEVAGAAITLVGILLVTVDFGTNKSKAS